MKNFRKAKILNLVIVLCFLSNAFSSSAFGATGAFTPMPAPQLPLLSYISINTANPHNYFNFLMDTGHHVIRSPSHQLETEAKKLINYFFLGLTLSPDVFWVNLQPSEPGRITSEELARTDMGKILLEQDLQLKKDVARYLHPQNPQGKLFWEALYQKIGKDTAKKLKIETNNRVWIVPDRAAVVETEDGALLTEAKLKVLSENEYLNKSNDVGAHCNVHLQTGSNENIAAVSESLMREIIIPQLTQDVNTGANYAPLRQIYQSLVLAEYYKRKYESPGHQVTSHQENRYSQLINKNQTQGLESEFPWSKDRIWQEYVESYQKGEYKAKYTLAGLNRMYVTGGLQFDTSPRNFNFKFDISGKFVSQDNRDFATVTYDTNPEQINPYGSIINIGGLKEIVSVKIDETFAKSKDKASSAMIAEDIKSKSRNELIVLLEDRSKSWAEHLLAVEALEEKYKEYPVLILIKALKYHDHAGFIAKIIRTLGRSKDKRAVEVLEQLLTNESSVLRNNAAYALEENRAVNSLPELLQDSRIETVKKLTKNYSHLAVDSLTEALLKDAEEKNGGNPHIRSALLQNLAKSKHPDAIGVLIWALQDDDYNVIADAAKLLGDIGDNTAVEPLNELLQEKNIPDYVSSLARETIRKLNNGFEQGSQLEIRGLKASSALLDGQNGKKQIEHGAFGALPVKAMIELTKSETLLVFKKAVETGKKCVIGYGSGVNKDYKKSNNYENIVIVLSGAIKKIEKGDDSVLREEQNQISNWLRYPNSDESEVLKKSAKQAIGVDLKASSALDLSKLSQKETIFFIEEAMKKLKFQIDKIENAKSGNNFPATKHLLPANSPSMASLDDALIICYKISGELEKIRSELLSVGDNSGDFLNQKKTEIADLYNQNEIIRPQLDLVARVLLFNIAVAAIRASGTVTEWRVFDSYMASLGAIASYVDEGHHTQIEISDAKLLDSMLSFIYRQAYWNNRDLKKAVEKGSSDDFLTSLKGYSRSYSGQLYIETKKLVRKFMDKKLITSEEIIQKITNFIYDVDRKEINKIMNFCREKIIMGKFESIYGEYSNADNLIVVLADIFEEAESGDSYIISTELFKDLDGALSDIDNSNYGEEEIESLKTELQNNVLLMREVLFFEVPGFSPFAIKNFGLFGISRLLDKSCEIASGGMLTKLKNMRKDLNEETKIKIVQELSDLFSKNKRVRDVIIQAAKRNGFSLFIGANASSAITAAGQQSYAGIDINTTSLRLDIAKYRSLSLDEKNKAVGKLKTLYALDALYEKKWDSLAYLYFQEVMLLVKDGIVADFDVEDRQKLLLVGDLLKAKGYLSEEQRAQDFLFSLQQNEPPLELKLAFN